MQRVTTEQIIKTWNMFEAREPDISTERLAMQTADTLGLAYDDVCIIVGSYWEEQNRIAGKSGKAQ